RYALLNANAEHGQTLQRLCVSPVTMLTRDFQPSILTQRGELVFLGPYLQYFSNAQALTIRWILENRSADPGIGPGDMIARYGADAAHTGDTRLYRYQLTVRKRGDELVVDNSGTDPQAGSINVTYAGLVGAFLSALTASLAPDLAGAYGGVYRR